MQNLNACKLKSITFNYPERLFQHWSQASWCRHLLIKAAFLSFLRKRNFLRASLTSSSMSHTLTWWDWK